MWEKDVDESGVEYYYAVCPYCGYMLKHCYDCKFFEPQDGDKPLYETKGRCKLRGIKILATSFACEYFIDLMEEDD